MIKNIKCKNADVRIKLKDLLSHFFPGKDIVLYNYDNGNIHYYLVKEEQLLSSEEFYKGDYEKDRVIMRIYKSIELDTIYHNYYKYNDDYKQFLFNFNIINTDNYKIINVDSLFCEINQGTFIIDMKTIDKVIIDYNNKELYSLYFDKLSNFMISFIKENNFINNNILEDYFIRKSIDLLQLYNKPDLTNNYFGVKNKDLFNLDTEVDYKEWIDYNYVYNALFNKYSDVESINNIIDRYKIDNHKLFILNKKIKYNFNKKDMSYNELFHLIIKIFHRFDYLFAENFSIFYFENHIDIILNNADKNTTLKEIDKLIKISTNMDGLLLEKEYNLLKLNDNKHKHIFNIANKEFIEGFKNAFKDKKTIFYHFILTSPFIAFSLLDNNINFIDDKFIKDAILGKYNREDVMDYIDNKITKKQAQQYINSLKKNGITLSKDILEVNFLKKDIKNSKIFISFIYHLFNLLKNNTSTDHEFLELYSIRDTCNSIISFYYNIKFNYYDENKYNNFVYCLDKTILNLFININTVSITDISLYKHIHYYRTIHYNFKNFIYNLTKRLKCTVYLDLSVVNLKEMNLILNKYNELKFIYLPIVFNKLTNQERINYNKHIDKYLTVLNELSIIILAYYL